MKQHLSISTFLLVLVGTGFCLCACIPQVSSPPSSLLLEPGVPPTAIPADTPIPTLSPPSAISLPLATSDSDNTRPTFDTVLDLGLTLSKDTFRVGETGQFFATITNRTNEVLDLAYLTVWFPPHFLDFFEVTVPEACYVFRGVGGNGQFMDCPYGADIPARFTGTFPLTLTAIALGKVSGEVKVDLGASAPYVGTLKSTLQVGLQVTP